MLIVKVQGQKQELEVLIANVQDPKEECAKKKKTISTAEKPSKRGRKGYKTCRLV